jgi:hypothetical protein
MKYRVPWLKKTAKHDLIFVTKVDSPKEQTRKLNRFHVDLKSQEPVHLQKTARYIIATSSCLSHGLNLPEATSVSFFEVDYNLATMDQGFHRHHRPGNKNKYTYCWTFADKNSAVEASIRERNDFKKAITNATTRKVGEPRDIDGKGKGKEKEQASSSSRGGPTDSQSLHQHRRQWEEPDEA